MFFSCLLRFIIIFFCWFSLWLFRLWVFFFCCFILHTQKCHLINFTTVLCCRFGPKNEGEIEGVCWGFFFLGKWGRRPITRPLQHVVSINIKKKKGRLTPMHGGCLTLVCMCVLPLTKRKHFYSILLFGLWQPFPFRHAHVLGLGDVLLRFGPVLLIPHDLAKLILAHSDVTRAWA